MSIRGSQIQVKRTVDSFEMFHQQSFIIWYNNCLTYGLTMVQQWKTLTRFPPKVSRTCFTETAYARVQGQEP